MNAMMERKWLGNKTKQGFYKRAPGGKARRKNWFSTIPPWSTCRRQTEVRLYFAAKKMEDDVSQDDQTVFNGTDKAAELAANICNNFIYAANRVPEICDSIVAIDNAMKWGYNHQLGRSRLGCRGRPGGGYVMKKLGKQVPKKIDQMLGAGFESFYTKKMMSFITMISKRRVM